MIALRCHIAVALCAVLFCETAQAQVTGSSEPAQANAYLDVNNVRARIFNDGNLFWNRQHGGRVYEVPKESGIHALWNAGVWIGGKVQDTLRVAAGSYGRHGFWAGPLQDGPPPNDCLPYDRIYEITRADILAYNDSGKTSGNLRDWPWHLGAPVLDGDGDPNNYNLDGGDRPALIGDQMLWWVMNDAGNENQRPSSDTPPIGMEVHASAFAFNRSPLSQHTAFYRYRLIYKGAQPFEEAYFGLFSELDLGSLEDDYVGSDTTLHLAFGYNSDNDDGGGYGTAPPAIGYTFLRSAYAEDDGRDNDRDGTIDEPGEQHGLAAFSCIGKGVSSRYSDPSSGDGFYNCLRGRWANGASLNEGGRGIHSTGSPTTFAFPGDPLTSAYWSMINLDGAGTPMVPLDMAFSFSTGPFTMQPGDSEEVVFAIVWSRGKDNLDSVRQLKTDVRTLRENAEQILTPASFPKPHQSVEPNKLLGVAHNYPNPFSQHTTIRYALPHEMHVRLRVFDVLGREVATLVDQRQEPAVYEVPFDANGLPDGVYFYRVELDYLSTTRSMLLVR